MKFINNIKAIYNQLNIQPIIIIVARYKDEILIIDFPIEDNEQHYT